MTNGEEYCTNIREASKPGVVEVNLVSRSTIYFASSNAPPDFLTVVILLTAVSRCCRPLQSSQLMSERGVL